SRVRSAQQARPNDVGAERGLIPARGDDAVGVEEGPWPQIDVMHPHPAVGTEADSEVESVARVWPIRPPVVRPIAVVPTRRRPADVARAVQPVHPCRRIRVTGQPRPSQPGVIAPPTVVVGNPAPRIVSDPYGRAAAISPVSVVVRTPSGRNVGAPAPGPDAADVRPRAVV